MNKNKNKEQNPGKQDLGGEDESVKVNCSFCGSEMECPKDMLGKSKKNMCYECFITKEPTEEEIKNVHVDIPMDKLPQITASGMADSMIEDAFPDVWSGKKSELKEMSRKALAAEMFGAGVYLGVKSFMETMQETEESGIDQSKQ